MTRYLGVTTCTCRVRVAMSDASSLSSSSLTQAEERNVSGEEDEHSSPSPPSTRMDLSVNKSSSVKADNDLMNLETPDSKDSSNSAAGESKGSEWIDVLGNGDLMKRVRTCREKRLHCMSRLSNYTTKSALSLSLMQVLQAGDRQAARPAHQSRVRMRTKGTLPSGKKVEQHSAISFIVGDGDVIQGMSRHTCTVSLHLCKYQ